MKIPIGEIAIGIATALVSILLVMGALLTSQAEVLPAPRIVAEVTSTVMPAETPATEVPGVATATPSPTPTSTPALAANCAPPPAGWVSYTILLGDSLEQLSAIFVVPVDQIKRVNCMLSGNLVPDTNLYLPVLPTATATPTPSTTPTRHPTATSKHHEEDTPTNTPTSTRAVCRPPAGWVIYVIKPGDTLISIAAKYNISYVVLQKANCLASANVIKYGQTLYVPNIPTSTPTETTIPPTKTRVPPTLATRTPTATPTPTQIPLTNTPVPTHTPTTVNTPTPTLVPTLVPTHTPTQPPTHTPTNTPLPPATDTPVPTATPTPTPTP